MCKSKIQSLTKSVREIISYLVYSVADGMNAVLFLLLLLSMGIFLAIYISSLPIPENIMKLLNISFSIILVAITAIYVILTGQIVKQTDKNSEIAFIEKRLEKLYYPLIDVLQNPTNMDLTGGNKSKFLDLNKIDKIIPFQYLASKDIENLLNDYINTALAERTDINYNYVPYIVNKDFMAKVKMDIEIYKSELKKLIKYRD